MSNEPTQMSSPVSNIESTVREWQSKALSVLLIVTAIAGLPSYAFSIFNAIQSGQLTLVLLAYPTVYFAVVVLAFLPRLDLRVRAWIFFALAYANAIASFVRLGLAGSGRLYLLVIPIFAILLLGARSGYLTTAISVMIYAVFAALAYFGLLGIWITERSNPLNLTFWLDAGVTFAAFMLMVVVTLERFATWQLRTVDAHSQAMTELERTMQTLERRVQERTRELGALNSIAAVVSQSLEIEEIMRDALAQTIQVCGMDTGSAYELDERAQTLVLIAQQGLSDDFAYKTTRLPLQVALAGKSLDVAKPLVWHVAHDYPPGELKESILHEGIQSIFAAPLMAKSKLVGAFVISSKTLRALTFEETALLLGVGQQVGVALENARLYKQAQQIAATAERSRLARELHDSVTQSLYSVMLYAEAAARSLADKEIAEAGDFLNELRDTAQDALREMRLLIFELRPLALEKNGLISALRARLNAVEGRGGMKTELQLNDDRMAEQLPFTMQEELYHIVQEALNNVIRHAHAQSVQVCLQFSENTIHLQVSDDGIGFDTENPSESSGLGLRGMRERVQRIGGTMQITSAAGKGTRVMVLVPMGGEK